MHYKFLAISLVKLKCRYGHRAAQILGCDFGQEEATTECLKNVSPELLQMLELPMEIMTQVSRESC